MPNNFCYKYPHPAVTTDCVLFSKNNQNQYCVLLIQRGHEPCKGLWAFPGGFMNIDETLEEGAARELKEETNIEDVALEQLHAFSTVNRDPRDRVITVVFTGIVDMYAAKAQAGDDAAKTQWFPIEALPPLAFDHDEIIKMAVEKVLKIDL